VATKRSAHDKGWNFARTPIVMLFDRRLGAYELALYSVLSAANDRFASVELSRSYLAAVIGVSRRTVDRSLQKLESAGLIKVFRNRFAVGGSPAPNRFELLPVGEVYPKDTGALPTLLQFKAHGGSDCEHQGVVTESTTPSDSEALCSDCESLPLVTESTTPSDSQSPGGWCSQAYDDEKDEEREEEEEEKKKEKEKSDEERKRATPSSSPAFQKKGVRIKSSRSALGSEGRPINGGNGTYDDQDTQVEDLQGLIEDPLPKKTPRRAKRRKKAASDDLVDGVARSGGAFLDTPVASIQPYGEPISPPVPPPPVETPEDVLELLRGVVEDKYGEDASRGLPMELTKVQKGKIRNTLLRKYTPDVILSMVRLLVWDWEQARSDCFPDRNSIHIPEIDALVQWAKPLAANISSGFCYTGARRGAPNSYHRLFIDCEEKVWDPDPF